MIETGTLLQNRFLIEEQIGIGGMGAVYRAVDQKFGTSVAVKETFYSDPNMAEAFEREARLLNGLHHPLFPHVSDHFVEGDGHFLVMEYIEGDDLSALLKRGERFPVDTVMRWTLDLLDGLDYLHSQDPPIIHRDVKPSNLKLTPRGNLLLLDFGMAKETSGNTMGMQSVFGYSRRYSPLEQIEGTGTDVRSDIFSLGATVYHLLTGTPPVDVLARASAIVAGKPDPLQQASEIDRDVPDLISAIVHSALALNADKRFITARAMWNAIEEALVADEPPNESAPVAAAAMPVVESFPALDAFENDDEHNALAAAALEREEIPADGALIKSERQADRIEVPITPVPEEAAEEAGPIDLKLGTKDPVIPPPRVASRFAPYGQFNRNLRSPLLWVPMLLLVLGLFAYGLYSGSNTSEPAQEPQVSDLAPAQVADVSTEIQDGFVPKSNADTVSSLEDESASVDVPATVKPEPNKGSAAVENRELTAAESAEKSSARDSKNAVLKPSRAASRSNGVTRPRVVRTTPNEPPVSSIESILSGMPDRPRQQRQWEILEDEELRRQRRLRRQMRQNRLRYPY